MFEKRYSKRKIEREAYITNCPRVAWFKKRNSKRNRKIEREKLTSQIVHV